MVRRPSPGSVVNRVPRRCAMVAAGGFFNSPQPHYDPAGRGHRDFMIATAGRDLRLDLFRGLALWLIFVDHIPSNIVNWLTIRNYGFSDAAEIFVFISGYTAAFVYGRTMEQRGVVVASARILKRAWTVYIAHVFIFVIFMAEIAYLTRSIENPLYNEEMGALDFMKETGDTLIHALLLKFKPTFMDVLPLYIVLLIGFPPVLWLGRGARAARPAASVGGFHFCLA